MFDKKMHSVIWSAGILFILVYSVPNVRNQTNMTREYLP